MSGVGGVFSLGPPESSDVRRWAAGLVHTLLQHVKPNGMEEMRNRWFFTKSIGAFATREFANIWVP